MFFEQIKINRGIPFQLKLPNEETMEAMLDAQENRNLEPFAISNTNE
jgi:antitoxin component of RelBE/YafQ-DinJ toxin-antitoxin module